MRSIRKTVVMILTLMMIFTNTVRVVAEDEETYTATYQFVMDDGSSLPLEVKARLPKARTNLKDGDVITNDSFDDVAVGDYIYVFIGWSEDSVTVDGGDLHFVGTWQKRETPAPAVQEDPVIEDCSTPQGSDPVIKDETDKPAEKKGEEDSKEDKQEEESSTNETYTVTYVFAEASGKNGINNLPEEIMALLPEEEKSRSWNRIYT